MSKAPKQAIRGAAGKMPRPKLDIENLTEPKPENTSPLGLYLKLNGISISAFGKAAGIPFKTARDWVSGDTVPNLVGAYEVERITKGAVPMEAWLGLAKAKATLQQMRSYQPDEIKKMPTALQGGGFALPEVETKRKKHAKELANPKQKPEPKLPDYYDDVPDEERET